MKILTAALLLTQLLTAENRIPSSQLEFFETKIRPVLAESCYECHNSVNKKKGKLALDWREPMLKGGSEGLTVVPGKPEESLLIKSIRHENDLEMPSKAPKLSDEVIADFEKWIKMGAPDPRTEKPTEKDLKRAVSWDQVRDKRKTWWSFQPLSYRKPPAPDKKEWQTNTIDAYIFAGLKKMKLEPSEKADKYTLLRRVHLVLTGLPPSPAEITQFVNSRDPQAYEKVIDRLLADKAYGERWARHWMDWYRFANSHGSEGDPEIPYADTYRDYLIRALNSDVPYDQLLKEHLAGDLMENPRVNKELGINESAIGPAHFRMVPHGFGVTDAYDEQITFTDNQIDVISKAMMGITVSCARCHNHKFDPISQKDFYRLYGIMLSNKPSTIIIDSREKQKINKRKIIALKDQIRDELSKLWLSEINSLPEKMAGSKLLQPPVPDLPKIPEGKKLSRKEKDDRREEERRIRDINNEKRSIKQLNHPFALWSLQDQPAAKLEAYKRNCLNFTEKIAQENKEAVKEASFYIDVTSPEAQFYTSGNGIDGVSPAGSFALNPGGDEAVTGIYPAGIYSHLISTKHAAVFSTKNFKVAAGSLNIKMAGSEAQARTPIRNYPMTHGGLHPASILKNERVEWLTGPGRWHYWQGETAHFELRTAADIIPRPGNERSWFGITEILIGEKTLKGEGASILEFIDNPEELKDPELITEIYKKVLSKIIQKWQRNKVTDKEAVFLNAFVKHGILNNNVKTLPKSLQDKINSYRSLEKEIPVPTRAPGIMEAQVIDQPLLIRGDYKKESDKVHRQFLEVFDNTPYPEKDSGRIQLAEDMVSRKNTLKTRVLINRLWAYVFGRGIVKSTDNFGRLGSEPSHLELLDFLSDNFEKNGWSIKKALRQMVTSRTFRSSSLNRAETEEIDPENNYLSYFSPRRLDAEAVYDTLYTVSGKSFQRAVYDKVVRNHLNPFLSTFNRPTPVSTVSSRLSTNVPAQALTMMNDFTVKLSSSTMNKSLNRQTLKTDQDKINALFMNCYCRPASAAEVQQCLKFIRDNDEDWVRLTEILLNSKEIIYVF